MSVNFNNTSLGTVSFNNNTMKRVYLNGQAVYGVPLDVRITGDSGLTWVIYRVDEGTETVKNGTPSTAAGYPNETKLDARLGNLYQITVTNKNTNTELITYENTKINMRTNNSGSYTIRSFVKTYTYRGSGKATPAPIGNYNGSTYYMYEYTLNLTQFNNTFDTCVMTCTNTDVINSSNLGPKVTLSTYTKDNGLPYTSAKITIHTTSYSSSFDYSITFKRSSDTINVTI